MLPTNRPCQEPYYQSIMNLDDLCDPEQTASLCGYRNVRASMCALDPRVAGNLRKHLTQKAAYKECEALPCRALRPTIHFHQEL